MINLNNSIIECKTVRSSELVALPVQCRYGEMNGCLGLRQLENELLMLISEDF